MVRQTLVLTATNAVLWVANGTAEPGLHTLVAVETAALKFASVVVECLIVAVLDATLSAAIAAVEVTLGLVVFSIAGSISNPDSDARDVLKHLLLQVDRLLDELARVVPIVND